MSLNGVNSNYQAYETNTVSGSDKKVSTGSDTTVPAPPPNKKDVVSSFFDDTTSFFHCQTMF